VKRNKFLSFYEILQKVASTLRPWQLTKTSNHIWTQTQRLSIISRCKVINFQEPSPKIFAKQKKVDKEIIYGIQASKDVKLSNISRALKEDIPLIKTEDLTFVTCLKTNRYLHFRKNTARNV